MKAYYNEIDPFAAAWLRELIKAGLIAPGDVDERDIREVRAGEISGYVQHHFFAGIGGWSLALRLAGWPDSQPVWTGSCPCQPFSGAGKRKGEADSRHLWPEFRQLIAIANPPVIFGEQVASALGKVWLAGVRAEVEALGYEVGAADLCAAGVSAPHIRQRLYWVAQSTGEQAQRRQPWVQSGSRLELAGMGESYADRCQQGNYASTSMGQGSTTDAADRSNTRRGHSNSYHPHWWSGPLQVGRNCIAGEVTRSGRRFSAQWRTQPGLSIVAHGISNRVGKLCGYGNAIVPQVAAEFIAAYMEVAIV